MAGSAMSTYTIMSDKEMFDQSIGQSVTFSATDSLLHIR